jgi:hypothetical protein
MSGEIDWGPVVQSLAAVNWTAILIAFISGLAAVTGPFWLWKRQSKRESASVKASLLAEVEALIEIVERRRFLPILREKQALLTARRKSLIGTFAALPEVFSVRIDSQYNRVYQGNVTKLGVLSAEEAKQIVRFHQLADSVRLDVTSGGALARGTDSPEVYGEAADLLEMALEIGHSLIGAKDGSSRK